MVGRSIAREFSTPERRAFWAGYLVAQIWCARRRVPFAASVLVGSVIGQGAKLAYRAAADIHALADTARLDYCGADCPGHTTGQPGESCLTGAAHGQRPD